MITVDGKHFQCGKHGIDYRICCEECQEKHEKFSKLTLRMRLDVVEKNYTKEAKWPPFTG